MRCLGAAFVVPLLACAGEPRPAGPPVHEAVSLLGERLARPVQPPEVRARQESLLAVAESARVRAPDNLDSLIWVGRRTAYLGRYQDAIDLYTAGVERHPNAPRLFRHRGHRYISIRRLDDAVDDLQRAAALVEDTPDRIEEDGLPNARGIPTSTLQGNIWYHLGLARYLTGDFAGGRDAWERGLAVATNPDMLTATAYWLYLAQRRLGDSTAAAHTLAAIEPTFDIIENHAYHRLMMLYQGRVPVDSLLRADDSLDLHDVTTAYGVGAWHLLEGREADAERIFRRILDARDQWPAFGYIAAEAELARAARR